MLAQRGQNYEHVHIISITQISFSYVEVESRVEIRRSRVEIRRSRVEIRRSRVEIRRSGN
jgi:urate oxidase